ncbi:MAG: NAD(P)-dependent oxidoreductase [Kiritimatiellae bacterium]|nr:NAD(P)-dependent oxidoreductase [Kiritimatiellia bacterium]
MKKVLIPTKLDAVAAKTLKANGNYTVVQDAQTPLPELAAAHPDTYALIVRSEPVDAAIMAALPQLKVSVRAGAGYDTIDIKSARKRGVDVMNTPGANANAVAEETITLMLADARFVIPADASTRAGGWEKKAFMGRELAGKTVGIVGLGNIGRLVAKRLKGFECRLLGYDPLVSSERAREIGVEPVGLEALFSESDFVTLHIPETEATRKLVGAKLLGLMKTGAAIVNCARAGIIDEEALRAVKKDRQLRFMTDVYPKDAPGPKSVADVADIMMPHLGASTHEANSTAARRAAEQLIDLDERGATAYIVNRDIPDGLDKAYCDLAFVLARLTRALAGPSAPLKMIETSFYGRLEPFAPWLLVSLLSGLWEDFDRFNDYKAAIKFLQDMGIEYVNRAVDAEKGFANSMTIDLIVEESGNRLKRTSVRGTVAEGLLMVSRINEFDRLYFEPDGAMLFCIYADRPGVIAAISRRLADQGINIEDMRNPHDAKTNRSLVIFKLNRTLSPDSLNAIAAEISASSSMCVSL